MGPPVPGCTPLPHRVQQAWSTHWVTSPTLVPPGQSQLHSCDVEPCGALCPRRRTVLQPAGMQAGMHQSLLSLPHGGRGQHLPSPMASDPGAVDKEQAAERARVDLPGGGVVRGKGPFAAPLGSGMQGGYPSAVAKPWGRAGPAPKRRDGDTYCNPPSYTRPGMRQTPPHRV